MTPANPPRHPRMRDLARAGAIAAAIAVAALGTALSLIPAITLPDHPSTKAVLVATHLVAAAVIIPVLSRRLPASAPQQPATAGP